MQAETTSFSHVTIDDVQRAIEKLETAGVPVSTRSVHAEIGRGSRTTIVKHCASLQLNRKVVELADVPSVSPLVLRELAREMDRLVKERTSQLFAELADVKASLELVVNENESFRSSADESETRVIALKATVAQQSGVADELRHQCASLSTQLAASVSDTENARQALALAGEKLRASDERVARLDAQLERTRKELAEARFEAQEVRHDLQAKTQDFISLQAQVEFGRSIQEQLDNSMKRVTELKAELEEARNSLASSDAYRLGLVERLKDTQHTLKLTEIANEQLLRRVLDAIPALPAGDTK